MMPIRIGATTSYDNYIHENWIKIVQHIEELGYSTVFDYDHFPHYHLDPIVSLTAAATATKKINVGTLVFAVDYRHPVIYARTAASLHILSGGRFEFGIGAGGRERDYTMSGLKFDRPIDRIRRLDEALTIIRSMWTQEKTNFKGKYFNLTEMEKAGPLEDGDRPKILVGGGGRQLLKVAGRHADIAGIQIREYLDSFPIALAEVRKRIERVKDSARKAGRDPDEIEFQMEFPWARITDDVELYFEKWVKNYGLSVDRLKAHPQSLVGTVDEMIDRLSIICEETEISYLVFGPTDVKDYAPFASKVIPALT
jgi:probable F420-dependent oxidoreductase